jgi:NADPH:quinone reductase-like Zn-dependent oxidoreductase
MPDSVAAQLHINPLTATMLVRAAIEAGVAEGGDRAIVVDASGLSVGKLVTPFAIERGIPVVGLVRRDAAVQQLAAPFAGASFVSTKADDWPERLRAAAPPGGLFVGLDAVGGQVGTLILDQIADGGAFIAYGDLSGSPLQANALSFAMRRTTVRGLAVTDWLALPEAAQLASA